MLKILVPVDGSESSDHAIAHVVALLRTAQPADVHLLHVAHPVMSGELSTVANIEVIGRLRREAADEATESARTALAAAGIRHLTHHASGNAAEQIAEYAREHRCDLIIMGTRGMGAIRSLVMGSVATKVVHLVDIPVTLVK